MKDQQLDIFEHAAAMDASHGESNIIDARLTFEVLMIRAISGRVVGIPSIRKAGILIVLDDVRRLGPGPGTRGKAA
ncbi:hypothetical protein [Gellertiella hungarica]|uniref:Uncharacterized protein n=1 Tax=Gellertiella hungarica TaxID=1572859 RepID=A0A7W6J4N8_9HYPH|nr:hypothetical protein [Gellertiella hungarica]MBB4064744.1 hypothetical protein [Gellertiella hungarica]